MKNQNDSVHLKSLGGIFILAITILTIMTLYSNKTNSLDISKTVETNTENIEIAETIERKTVTSRTMAESREIVKKIEEEIAEKNSYISIEDVKISRDMDLTVRTGLSKEDFKLLISNCKYDTSKFFYDNADTIYDLCKEYQINEVFYCGLISAESGWNIASNHRKTNNYISIMKSGGILKSYDSVEEGLEAGTRLLHNNYLTESGCYYYGKTLQAVQTKFCPSGTWVNLVYGRMQQLLA